MTLPNFLIVGAQKSGTTSLFEYLSQHPEVYTPPCKEPHYFSRAPYPNLAKNDKEYEALFKGASSQKAIGEASVSYLTSPKAPERIKKLLPHVNIIILLREPVSRAYSQWWHMYQLGYENLSFEEALHTESARMSSTKFIQNCPVYHRFYYYYNSGLYYEQIKRYFKFWGRSNVKIYIFEEFIKNPIEVCREIFDFIGVKRNFRPNTQIYNKSHIPKNSNIQKFLTSPPNFLKEFYDKLPETFKLQLYDFLKKIYWSNMQEKKRPPLDDTLKKKLHKKYIEDIKKLEKIINKDLKIWYQNKKN